MPFRAKVKKALGGGTSTAEDPDKPDKSFLNKTAARRPLTKADKANWPDNVYKPGEPMPRPKYRGPWNQAHQDKLSAFSFGSSSGRRKSSATARTGSEYSPMGSKLPSRGPSRRNSAVSWGSLKGSIGKRITMGSRKNSTYGNSVAVEENGEGDDDVGNGKPCPTPSRVSSVRVIPQSGVMRIAELTWLSLVGLSRSHTRDARPGPAKDGADDIPDDMAGLSTHKTATNGNGNGYLNGFTEELDNQRTVTQGRLFTEEELANALTASTLRPSRRERE